MCWVSNLLGCANVITTWLLEPHAPLQGGRGSLRAAAAKPGSGPLPCISGVKAGGCLGAKAVAETFWVSAGFRAWRGAVRPSGQPGSRALFPGESWLLKGQCWETKLFMVR